MIAYLMVAFFTVVGCAAISSIADSALKARNAFYALRGEVAGIGKPSPTVELVKLRPRAATPCSAIRRPAPRLPRAVAA